MEPVNDPRLQQLSKQVNEVLSAEAGNIGRVVVAEVREETKKIIKELALGLNIPENTPLIEIGRKIGENLEKVFNAGVMTSQSLTVAASRLEKLEESQTRLLVALHGIKVGPENATDWCHPVAYDGQVYQSYKVGGYWQTWNLTIGEKLKVPENATRFSDPVACDGEVYQSFEVDDYYQTWNLTTSEKLKGPENAINCRDLVVCDGRVYQNFFVDGYWQTWNLITGEELKGSLYVTDCINPVIAGEQILQVVKIGGRSGLCRIGRDEKYEFLLAPVFTDVWVLPPYVVCDMGEGRKRLLSIDDLGE